MNRKKQRRTVVILTVMLFIVGSNTFFAWAFPQEEGFRQTKWIKNSMTTEEFLAAGATDHQYAIADVSSSLRVRAGAGISYDVIGRLPPDGFCHVEYLEGEWAYVTSGDVEGYVYAEYLITGLDGVYYVEKLGAAQVPLAYQLETEPKTEAVQETMTAVADTDPLRQQVVEYALQFVGNPYVWGGTSLTEGADCSGFVQAVYQAFGITIPRVSKDQSVCAQSIAVEDAQPGDLIFYAREGEIYHVVMYIGDGQVVHASSPKTGIKISKVSDSQAVWAISLAACRE
ncbi:MAG: NlpC/P60 family protein [Lachnospiraceae bacterium]|jgi:hypothetical protein